MRYRRGHRGGRMNRGMTMGTVLKNHVTHARGKWHQLTLPSDETAMIAFTKALYVGLKRKQDADLGLLVATGSVRKNYPHRPANAVDGLRVD